MPKRRICRENSKYMPGESYVVIFALAERLSISATLHQGQSSLAKNGSKFDHTAPESVKRVKSIAQILVKNKMEG